MMPLGRPGPSESGCGPVCGAAAGAHVSSPGAGRTAPCGGAFRGADSVYHSEPAGRASYDPPASDSDAPSCPLALGRKERTRKQQGQRSAASAMLARTALCRTRVSLRRGALLWPPGCLAVWAGVLAGRRAWATGQLSCRYVGTRCLIFL